MRAAGVICHRVGENLIRQLPLDDATATARAFPCSTGCLGEHTIVTTYHGRTRSSAIDQRGRPASLDEELELAGYRRPREPGRPPPECWPTPRELNPPILVRHPVTATPQPEPDPAPPQPQPAATPPKPRTESPLAARRAVLRAALQENPARPNRLIGRPLGADPGTVRRVRAALEDARLIHVWRTRPSGRTGDTIHVRTCWCGNGETRPPKRLQVAAELRRNAARSDWHIGRVIGTGYRLVAAVRHELEACRAIHRYATADKVTTHQPDCWCHSP